MRTEIILGAPVLVEGFYVNEWGSNVEISGTNYPEALTVGFDERGKQVSLKPSPRLAVSGELMDKLRPMSEISTLPNNRIFQAVPTGKREIPQLPQEEKADKPPAK